MQHGRIYVWDLPTRLFHWSFAFIVLGAIASGLSGGSWMVWHQRLGLAAIGLLTFRCAWGLTGSTYARFATFLPTFSKLAAYLRGNWRGAGHNPLGALSVFALLGITILQALTGLFANDDIAFNGPLYALISKTDSDRITTWHRLGTNVLYALIALHMAAIGFYRLAWRQNLVRPMLTGWHEGPPEGSAQGGSRLALIGCLLLALLAVYVASGIWLPAPAPIVSGPAPGW